MKITRTALLGGVAMMAIAAGAQMNTAQAQVQSPGWFGSGQLTWYAFEHGTNFRMPDSDGDLPKVAPGMGLGGRVYLGYRFSNPWDVAFGVQGAHLFKDNPWHGDVDDSDNGNASITQRAWYWAGDAEIGYNGTSGNQFGYRMFIGARIAQWHHKLSGHEDTEGVGNKDRWTGVGPRIGMSGAYRLVPGGNWSIFADLSGSYLWGGGRAKTLSDSGTASSGKRSRDTWNIEGQVGLSYDVAPDWTIAAGWRGEYWSNVGFGKLEVDDADQVYGGVSRLMHGPFVRVAYNIGAPRMAPAAVPPAPAAVMTKNYIVFFDFDRSNLTGQAQATIREAAAASKTGGVQRVNVTGHADKSGTDQYNMALSLRRANTVKDELVRNGVPANAIAVVARGESQPLVPTADGVREPQNRRVEIVLN